MIPVFINNRDLIHSPRELIRFFRQVPEAYIVLCDNASTHEPLRQWLDFIRSSPGAFPDLTKPKHIFDRPDPQCGILNEISLHWIMMNSGANEWHCLPDELWCFPENRGPRAATQIKNSLSFKFDYYFLCEPDLDFTGADPLTFFPHLVDGFRQYPNTQGVGVSFKLDDLPPGKMRDYVLSIELPYTPGEGFYVCGCDTAGVLRRSKPAWDGGYEGIRTANIIARHLPWYFIPENQELPRCEQCGYTHEDASYHMDHRLCVARGGKIPPGIRTPEDFQWYFDHADPRGTVYTSRVLDKTREPL